MIKVLEIYFKCSLLLITDWNSFSYAWIFSKILSFFFYIHFIIYVFEVLRIFILFCYSEQFMVFIIIHNFLHKNIFTSFTIVKFQKFVRQKITYVIYCWFFSKNFTLWFFIDFIWFCSFYSNIRVFIFIFLFWFSNIWLPYCIYNIWFFYF